MSVSKMKRLTVFAHKDDTDALIKRLVRLRCVEIGEVQSGEDPLPTLERYHCDAVRSELESFVSDINEAMNTLNRYTLAKRSLLHSKARVNADEFVASGAWARAKETVRKTLQTQGRQLEIQTELNKIHAEMASVKPYMGYDVPLNITGTERTELFLGVLPVAVNLDVIGKELYVAGAVAELIHSDSTGQYIAVICCRVDSPGVSTILTNYGFVRAVFREQKQTAEECMNALSQRARTLNAEKGTLEDTLWELGKQLEQVEILYDVTETELTATIQKQKMLSTECTVLLSGWVPEDTADKVSDVLERFACAYELRDPTEEEKPPILLKNNGFAENFEWVLGMYSYPMYGKFDPTFIMSIFYFIIFGIMFADAGYGLILILACFGGIKLLHPSKSMERFLKMFGYCGISCVICGVLFGAYFGDLPIAFMKNMLGMTEAELPNLALLGSSAANVAILFDPLQNPMGFLVVSLGIGAVHLIAGMAVKFVLLCKEGHVWDAIFDIGAYWLLFAGIALLFLVPSVGMWVAIGAVALIILTHGRAEKNILMKLMKGLLGIYDLINYVSDLLSYSRILALGLAAGVIAQVVNILGTMGGFSVGGFIVLILAFVVGHLLNMAINVLGTFVHASRLQYIEFFNKFYEDGGVAFEPALPSEKYTEE